MVLHKWSWIVFTVFGFTATLLERGHVIGKDTDHRTRVLYFKPCRRGYEGSWCVDCGQMWPYLYKSSRSGEDSAFCSRRTGKKAASSSMARWVVSKVCGCPRQGLRSDSVTWNVLISLIYQVEDATGIMFSYRVQLDCVSLWHWLYSNGRYVCPTCASSTINTCGMNRKRSISTHWCQHEWQARNSTAYIEIRY